MSTPTKSCCGGSGGFRSGWMLFALVLVGVVIAMAWDRLQPVAQDAVPWRQDPQAAIDQAKADGRPALLFFTAKTCPPCQKMKREVFSDPARAEKLEQTLEPVLVDLTTPQKAESSIALQYEVRYTPTLVLLGSDGQEIARSGPLAADTFDRFIAGSLTSDPQNGDAPPSTATP